MSNRRGNAAAPTVSVLLAVPGAWQGGARRLAASIDSILSQTLPELELILIDQGADGVPDLLDLYDDPRLKYLAAGTAAAAWEEGFGESSGRYLAFLEAGDVARPTRLAVQSLYLDSHPGTVLLATATRQLQDGIPLPRSDPPIASPAMLGWRVDGASRRRAHPAGRPGRGRGRRIGSLSSPVPAWARRMP
jgi:glycosyltransferase involved in cell wall biosynthesis